MQERHIVVEGESVIVKETSPRHLNFLKQLKKTTEVC